MMRRAMALCALLLEIGLGGCVTNPKATVLDLDSTDPKWTSRRCVAARKAVYEFDDHRTVRAVVGVAGNAVVPFAGTATSLALGASQSKTRKRLNHQVESACISRHRRKRSA